MLYGTRAAAPRYSSTQATTKQGVLRRNFPGLKDSPYVNSLTGISPGPALAVFAFRPHVVRPQTKTSLRLSTPDAHPAVGVPRKTKNKTPATAGFLFLPPAGVELATSSLGRNRSIQLSYGRAN